MIHQILQALILTKVTGMNLSTVFPILMESTFMILSLLTITQQFWRSLVNGIVTAMFVHAVIDDSNDDKTGTCGLESERPIFTAQEAVTAFKTVT